MIKLWLINVAISLCCLSAEELNNGSFSREFLFGVSTSSYQIEGAWNVSGKGESIWDHLTQNYPSMIADQSNGNSACNSYYKLDEDVALLKQLGAEFYRFSISWPRILPNGLTNNVNQDGIRYYNQLLNLLQENGIKAVASLYHWDLPQSLQENGGWLNDSIVDWYTDFAKLAFEEFGDRVDIWITFNEPYQICAEGYGLTDKAPAYNNSGIADYICGYHLLQSHAQAWHLYNDTYRSTQNGKIGIVMQAPWAEPNNSSNEEDIAAAERLKQFYFGWFAHPIFTDQGDYPEVMKTNIAYRSALEGYNTSRLPAFTEEEINYIKGTSDFFGLNHYTSVMAAARSTEAPIGSPSYLNDVNITYFYSTSWEPTASARLKVVPWGFRKVLVYIKNEYNNPQIFVTENGYAGNETLNDTRRISYYQAYLSALLDAMDEGADVRLYAFWSLMDNFEWLSGYTVKFGIVHVDFDDENRTRTPKASSNFFKDVVTNRRVTGFSSSDKNMPNLFVTFIMFLSSIFSSCRKTL